MFSHCTSLEVLDLSSVESVDYSPFGVKSGIKELKLGLKELTNAEESIFSGTSLPSLEILEMPNLTTICVNNSVGAPGSQSYLSMFYQPTLKILKLPSLTTITVSYAFANLTGLETIEAPLFKTAGSYDYLFSGCTNLTSVDFPLLETVGNQAFDGCSSLKSANL